MEQYEKQIEQDIINFSFKRSIHLSVETLLLTL